MTELIEVEEGLFIQPCKVMVVKATEEGKCAVFMSGQSAVDGSFIVHRDAVDVADDVNEALSAGEDD